MSVPSSEAESMRLPPPLAAPVSPEQARRRLIQDRQQRSIVWRIIHLLGSLQLALFLLATIALACAVATFYEAEFNAKIAQHYIYKAPWFLFWLGLLCVNLFAVTLTRWPWQKKHTGFILTHYGIITLLLGAVIGSRFGFEGNVTLHKDAPPTNRITTSRSILQLEDPHSPALLVMPFDASVLRMSPERPRRLPVPGTAWTIQAIGFAPDLVREKVLVPASALPEGVTPAGAGAGVVLRLHSDMVGHRERMVLTTGNPPETPAASNRASLFGMAEVLLLPHKPALVQTAHTETQMVFARAEPVKEGQPSGVRVTLSPDGTTVRLASAQTAAATYLVREVLGREVRVGAARLLFREYWPDFAMQEGKPVSRSAEPNHPALLVQVFHETSALENAGAEGLPPRGLALVLAPGTPAGSEIAGSPPTLAYYLLRDGRLVESGETPLGQARATGWNDWTFEVLDWQERTVAVERVRPASPDVPEERTGIPGFLAVLDTGEGQQGEPTWIESGRVTTLAAGHRFLRVGYGLQLERVPFTIRLVDFQVPRFEGTQTPANFIATVEFRDTATGATKQDVARMNRPANWPGGWWALVTGLNYKFSQAEWNPQDLGETTLQVLYDPGWLLKWIGSLGICVGIGLMFYWKPR